MTIMDETENIYEYLKLTPADSNDRVVQELDAQISTWTNQLTRQAARAKAKLDVLKRFKAELAANPNMLKEHADKYALLIKQKRQQQEKAIREDAAIFVVNGQIEESALAEMAKKNPSFTRDEILKILGATIKQKKVSLDDDMTKFFPPAETVYPEQSALSCGTLNAQTVKLPT